jgi:hypothetical protein
VEYIYREKIAGWFEDSLKEKDRSVMFQAFVDGDAKIFQEELQKLLETTISYHDYAENFYHGFLAGVMTGMDGYLIKSNREGGEGRSDLFVKPASPFKTAYVIEFKIADSVPELEGAAQKALHQIRERGYEKELRDEGYGSIGHCGVAFFKKGCYVVME